MSNSLFRDQFGRPGGAHAIALSRPAQIASITGSVWPPRTRSVCPPFDTRAIAGSSRTEIVRFYPSSGTVAVLSQEDDSEPASVPDGARIVFTSFRFGNAEIMLMNSDGRDAIRITAHPALDSSPAHGP